MAAARRWIGTPVSYKGREIGKGVDCVGLVLMSGMEAGVLGPISPSLPVFSTYGLLPNPKSMLEGLQTHMVARTKAHCAGDVGFFDFTGNGHPVHMGILATFEGRPSLIHADASNKRRVAVEITFDGLWHARLASVWRFPGVA